MWTRFAKSLSNQNDVIANMISHVQKQADKIDAYNKEVERRERAKNPKKERSITRPTIELPTDDEFQLRSIVATACGNSDVEEWYSNRSLDEVYKWLCVQYAHKLNQQLQQ